MRSIPVSVQRFSNSAVDSWNKQALNTSDQKIYKIVEDKKTKDKEERGYEEVKTISQRDLTDKNTPGEN